MIDYVVIDAFPVENRHVLLVRKNRPDYLKGMLNLTGGKLEAGENPVQCALRELKEEAGLDEVQEYDPMVYYPPEPCGIIWGDKSIIHCVKVPVSIRQGLKPREEETEPVSWFDFRAALNHPQLMPNLRVILPLMRVARGWEVDARNSDWHGEKHVLSVRFSNDIDPVTVIVKGLAAFGKELNKC